MAKKSRAGRVDPAVREKALELVRYVRPKDWRAQVHELWAFVKDRIRYVRDIHNVETIHDARTVLEMQQGDCDDKSILLASLLESIGHPARFIAVGFRPNDFSHVLVQTPIAQKWVSLETTEPVAMGWFPPNVQATMIQNVS